MYVYNICLKKLYFYDFCLESIKFGIYITLYFVSYYFW